MHQLRAEVVQRLLAEVRLLRFQLERDVPRQIEIQIEERFGVRVVVHLLENEHADHGLHGLVGAAVTLVVQVAEGVLVDERERAVAELPRPVAFEALALVVGQEVRGRQQARLRVARSEHGDTSFGRPPRRALYTACGSQMQEVFTNESRLRQTVLICALAVSFAGCASHNEALHTIEDDLAQLTLYRDLGDPEPIELADGSTWMLGRLAFKLPPDTVDSAPAHLVGKRLFGRGPTVIPELMRLAKERPRLTRVALDAIGGILYHEDALSFRSDIVGDRDLWCTREWTTQQTDIVLRAFESWLTERSYLPKGAALTDAE